MNEMNTNRRNFIKGFGGQAKCFSDIDYSTGILEGMLVGCMSQRLNRTLAWNATTKRFDDKDANALIRPYVRPGWEF